MDNGTSFVTFTTRVNLKSNSQLCDWSSDFQLKLKWFNEVYEVLGYLFGALIVSWDLHSINIPWQIKQIKELIPKCWIFVWQLFAETPNMSPKEMNMKKTVIRLKYTKWTHLRDSKHQEWPNLQSAAILSSVTPKGRKGHSKQLKWMIANYFRG